MYSTSTDRTYSTPSRHGAHVLAVTGASGGIGASCLAAVLTARAVQSGHQVVCADAHPHDGGIDTLFDLDTSPGARWPDLARARGRLDGDALSRMLPATPDGARILSSRHTTEPPEPTEQPELGPDILPPAEPGQLPDPTVQAATLTALAEVSDLLVLDLGAALRPPCWAVTADGPAFHDLVLVVGDTVPALARATHALDHLMDRTPDHTRIWLAQRCPRGRADLGEHVAERLDIPLIATIPDDPGLDRALARGRLPQHSRSLARAADIILETLSAQTYSA